MNRALLVIDVQQSFLQRPLWRAAYNPGITGPVSRLVDVARAEGDLVVWVLHSEPGTGDVFDPALGYVRPMDGLTPLPGEERITKTSHNCFTTTNLQQILTQRGIGELVVCGIRTEQCCETTARIGSDLGFGVSFVTDATATTPIPHRDAPPEASVEEILADPRTLGVEAIVERTEYALAGRFATIRTVAELAGAPTPVN
ncbi:isochorismatase family protein [Nonomuraea wenchangensis]|uniref:cysteine hydrolase family protein n=1 Tax=Nonomuraea wenchangensis TaxID=568860 RepID=UPI003416D240